MTASVTVVLDTTPPGLTVTAHERVDPPVAIEIVVVANEPLGSSSYVFTDADSVAHPVGAVRTSPTTDVILLPSVGLATGEGVLAVDVHDTAGNRVRRGVPILVYRPRAFDILASTDPVYLLRVMGSTVVMDVVSEVRSPFDVAAQQDGALDVSALTHQVFDLEARSDDGD